MKGCCLRIMKHSNIWNPPFNHFLSFKKTCHKFWWQVKQTMLNSLPAIHYLLHSYNLRRGWTLGQTNSWNLFKPPHYPFFAPPILIFWIFTRIFFLRGWQGVWPHYSFFAGDSYKMFILKCCASFMFLFVHISKSLCISYYKGIF